MNKEMFDKIASEAFDDELKKIAVMMKADEGGKNLIDSARVLGRQTAESYGGAAGGAIVGGGIGAGIGALIGLRKGNARAGAQAGAKAGAIAGGVPGLIGGYVHGTTASLRNAEKRFKERYKKDVNFHGGAMFGSQLLGGAVGSLIPGPGSLIGNAAGGAMYLNAKKKEALGIK